MFALLNWRLWAAVAIAAAILGAGFTGNRMGRATVRAEWNVEKLAQAEAVRLQLMQRDRDQDQLNAKARKADNAYQVEKTKRAAADRVVGGLRDQLTASLDRAASEDTATPSGVDAADPRPAIAGECVRQLGALDKAYGKLVDQARALQTYTGQVCVATP